MNVTWLRWDHADLNLYKQLTGAHLQAIWNVLTALESHVDSLNELSLFNPRGMNDLKVTYRMNGGG